MSVLAALAIVLSPLAVVAAHASANVQNDTATTKSGCSITLDVLANDSASDDETVGNLSTPTIGTASVNANQSVTLDLSGAAGQTGTSTFTYDAMNGATVDGTGTVTVTITAATSTDPSVVTACDDTVTVEPNHLETLGIFGNDDGCSGDCTVSIESQAADGTATASGPTDYPNATYISNAGFQGTDTFTYELHNNDTGDTDTATVTVTVARRGPADVVLTAAPSGVKGTWTAPLSGDFTKTVIRYTVDGLNAQYPQTPTDGDGGASFDAPATSGTVDGLTPGTTYLVDVFAVYSDNGYVGPVGQAEITPTSTPVVPTISLGSWGPASRATAKAVSIKATVGNVSSGQLVVLQRKSGSSWTDVKSGVIDNAGSYTLKSAKQPSGSFSYRVAVEDSSNSVLKATGAKTLSFYTATLKSVVKTGHEAVTIKNTGKVSVNLKGWTIVAKHGKTVTLPKFTLKAGKSVRVHLKKGKTTSKVIYVNKSNCFGNTHDTLTLRDTKAAGHSVVATRTY